MSLSDVHARGHPKRMCTPWGREGVSNNAEKSGQGEGGGLVVSGHTFQRSSCTREEGI